MKKTNRGNPVALPPQLSLNDMMVPGICCLLFNTNHFWFTIYCLIFYRYKTKMTKSSYDGPTTTKTLLLSHPKYQLNEFRKKLIKLCHRKLRILDDPDSILCRAVLNNNTLKYCQNNQNKEKENIVPHDKTEISDFIDFGEQDKDTERANEKN